MHAGNKTYSSIKDIPDQVPVFPLSGALLLPGGQMPLNIFEPRYLEMIDAALRGDRVIGMIQPKFSGETGSPDKPNLCSVGCLGRVASFAESGDGRYLVSLQGICRFRVSDEVHVRTHFRQCRIIPFASDLTEDQDDGAAVDREELLRVFRAYLEANELEADWESVQRAGNDTLVNALSMMSPYGPAEKQALLEAPDLKSRAETLIALTEMSLARDKDDSGRTLQ
ncbi:LON peptidase substrate-binding domain-containing protein [Oricola cellulosilytica]|uniref:ATP-dependent protease n=1 Tax=Oricola cellulosilytica TaxID=1429082 RepID=A0A4R0PGB6_9HYPH|nr:LON peptidase substrate-binding domain-containing protein [Oricola cellulosilytica]TCD15904.1 ATP-dependent protease [Oricola cellulosilytica]